MRKLLLLILTGILIWFFGFSDPMFRQEVYSMFKASENTGITKKVGQPMSPKLVQKLYQPHTKGMDE